MRAQSTRARQCLLFAAVCAGVVVQMAVERNSATTSSPALRELKATGDPRETYECAAPRWVEQFERKYGGHVFELLFLLYLFVGMAVVIDEYFVACLERLLESSTLPQDVVGATFLSFANASPEIFISCVSTASTGKVGEGLSAVIGAVVYNLLVVAGVCVLVAPQPFTLGSNVVKRDMPVFFAVLAAVVVVFSTGRAGLAISLVLFLLYPTYLLVLFLLFTTPAPLSPNHKERSSPVPHDDPQPSESERESLIGSNEPFFHSPGEAGSGGGGGGGGDGDGSGGVGDGAVANQDSFVWRATLRMLNFLTWPWDKLFSVVFYPRVCKKFAVAFVLCLASIMGLSFAVLLVVKRVECGLEVNGDLIGLTLVGIGITIPNTLSNSLMAKQGYTDMAISSCLNANVAGILLGMAGPWAALNLANNAPVKLKSTGLRAAVILLAIAYVVFVGAAMATRWELRNAHGYGFILMYALFLVLILLGVLGGEFKYEAIGRDD